MDYWKKQGTTPFFKNLDFDRPEQKSLAGTLTIIGGNSGSFRIVAASAAIAEQIGVHNLHVLLPDSLKKTVPPTIPNIVFAPSEPSGGFSRMAAHPLLSAANQADIALIIGDLGRNATTATTITDVVKTTQTPCIITRDTLDLITPEASAWIDRESLTILATLPQLQKLFSRLYYPRIIALTQPLNQLLETLHKFTITYPNLVIATLHNDQYITAAGGTVITTPLADTRYSPISLMSSGDLATITAIYQIRQPSRPLEATTTAVLASS